MNPSTRCRFVRPGLLAGLVLLLWLLPGWCYADRNLNHPGYVFTWHDEFDGNALNASKWNIVTGSNLSTGELSLFTPSEVYVTNGTLVLRSELSISNGVTSYLSGKVTSANKFDQLYGWFEWNGQIPVGQGYWPAYWMLSYAGWPPEIDVMETIGTSVYCNTMSLHWGPLPPGCTIPWDCGHTENSTYCGPNFSAGFHTYAVDWEPWGVRFYVDGVNQYYAGWLGNCTNSMWLIMNTALGGPWAGAPDGTTPFPGYNLVDYVRVFKPIFGQYPLLNPGFESGEGVQDFDNWNTYETGNLRSDPVPANSRSGSRSVQIWGRYNGQDNTTGLYQDLWAVPGDGWQSSIWGRNRPGDTPQGGNQGRLKLEFVDAAGNVIISLPQTNLIAGSPTNYARFLVSGTAPAGTARARIVMEYFQTGNAAGSVDFDDARLDLLWRCANILANPGFESGLAGWMPYGASFTNYSVNIDPAIALGGGSNYFKVFGQFNGKDNFSGVYQDTDCTSGTAYTADGWGYTLDSDQIAGDNTAWIEVTCRDAATNMLSLYRSAPITAGTATGTWMELPITNQFDPNTFIWVRGVTNIVAPSGTAFVRYQVVFSQPADNPAGSVYFDGLSLTPVAALIPPSISNPLPDGTIPLAGSPNTFSFTVSSPSTVSSNAIQVVLNGIDVSPALVLTGSPVSWNVVFPGLALNQIYTAIINATNAGGSAARTVTFDTFDPASLTIEAEDFDFGSGQFINDPIPSSAAATRSYFGRIGINSIDENYVIYLGSHLYRPQDDIATEVATDFLRQKYLAARQTDPAVLDYDVGWWVNGAWMNYTRTIPTNNYYIYGRMSGGNGLYAVSLDQITGGRGTSSQTVQPLGVFRSAGLGWTNWNWVPMTTPAGGPPLAVSLGGVTTLRATTTGNADANFYMLVPAPAAPVLSASTTATGVHLFVPTRLGFNYVVLFSDDLSSGNWKLLDILTGDGTAQSVNDPAVRNSRFYRVLVQ